MKQLTLFTFFDLFPNEEACFVKLLSLKYPEGVVCKTCTKKTHFTKHKTRPVYQCSCGYQISLLKGTIFEGSSTRLQYWFFAIFAMATTKNGLSAMQLQRLLGINYKTCFRMLHKIRSVMKPHTELLVGTVESDETFLHYGRRTNRTNFAMDSKAIIMGMVQRGGDARFEIIPTTGKYAILEKVKKHIDVSSHVMTDQGAWYTQLKKHGYKHDYVIHRREYVSKNDPNVYTQTIESLWSQYKRNLLGTYRGAVSVKYLPNYNNEYTWQYSNRNNEGLFTTLLNRAITGV